MRRAVIDLGTNSTRLFIAEVSKNKEVFSVLRRAEITRLGEGVAKKGILKSEAIKRTLETIADYQKLCQKYQVGRIRAAATSAVREAHNAKDFLVQVEDELGLKIEVLSGEKEAQLAFLGATYDIVQKISFLDLRLFLVIDIGGGSTELIVGTPPEVKKLFSLDIGCVRLTEKFIRSDPPEPAQVAAAKSFIERNVYEAKEEINLMRKDSSITAIGVAGTITSLSAIKQKLKEYDSDKVHGSKITKEEIWEILEMLKEMTVEERKEIPSLEPRRADIIMAGTLILHGILQMLNLKEIIVSEKDILDGLILS